MTNEEKNWVNEELGKVEDIPEEHVEKMVDEIPQESEEETISQEQFDELAREVTEYVDSLEDNLSKYGCSVVVGVGIKNRRLTIVKGSRPYCKKHIAFMVMDLVKAVGYDPSAENTKSE